jgi:hypothetical protein
MWSGRSSSSRKGRYSVADNQHSAAGVIVMSQKPASIRDLIGNPTGRPQTAPPPEPTPPAAMPVPDFAFEESQAPPKKADPLPRPGDVYRAHARFLNNLSVEPRLIHFVRRDMSSVGFSYSDLRRVSRMMSAEPGGGPLLVLRFVEAVVTEVGISGCNLDDMHQAISDGHMPWVWEQPAGFKTRNDAMTVITRIEIKEIER